MINSNCTNKVVGHFFCLIFLLYFSLSNGQSEAAFWYFGNNAGLDFNSGDPVAITNGQLRTNEGCSTISNKKGELLFYTDGISVWDRNHNKMPNGIGLLGNPSSTQSAIIIPKPNSDNIYFIFTITNEGRSDGLRYSEVDLSLNYGNGDITSNKNILLATPCAEKISAVQHANGSDFWVVSHAWNSADFLIFKVTDKGVVTTPLKQTVGAVHDGASNNSIGYMKFSPNGKKLALAKWNVNSLVEIFDFDSRNGSISNAITLDNLFGNLASDGAYGLEFSPNSNMLYVTALDFNNYMTKLHQFNISIFNKTSILNSNSVIYKGNFLLSAIQLAINGKIYISNTLSQYLDVINDPNNPDIACNYVPKGLGLNGKASVYGLPPFIQSFFVANIKAENVCLGEVNNFSLESDEQINSIIWDFGDGTTSTDINSTHIYSLPGLYKVKALAKYGYNTINLEKEVQIYGLPKIGILEDVQVCDDLSRDGKEFIDLNQFNELVLDGQSNTEFKVSYHLSLSDAQGNVNQLPASFQNINNPQEIFVKVENNVTGCFRVGKFNVIVDNPIHAGQPENLVACDDETNDGKEIFDLRLTENQISNGVSGLVSFYESFEDAETKTNTIAKDYKNRSNPQKIFARLESADNSDCFDIASFFIEVKELPIIEMNETWYLCSGQSTTLFLDSEHDGYLWSTGETTSEIVVDKSGDYEVTVFKDYENVYKTLCSNSKIIKVIESSAPESLDIKINDWTNNTNSITVNASGIGDYEFSLDDTNYQDSNVFYNLKTGDYNVYVRDKNGCGTVSQEVYLLNYPKFFTPNGDGYNDYWKIQFSESEPDMMIGVFDRYGKLIKQFSSTAVGWDGNFNGVPLPVSDYWFVVDRPSKNKQYKGHFTLKR